MIFEEALLPFEAFPFNTEKMSLDEFPLPQGLPSLLGFLNQRPCVLQHGPAPLCFGDEGYNLLLFVGR